MTIAILSWGAHRTLLNTLRSYQTFGIDQTDDERIIFFQEISQTDIDIANKFGYRAIGSHANIGIANAYRALVIAASGDLFLFLENDWVALESTEGINEAQELLYSGTADVVRLRHRRYPGSPLWTDQFKGREQDKPTHLLDCVHWHSNPEEFPQIDRIRLFPSQNYWYTTTARNANWTNNPTMFRTEWLYDNILTQLGNKDIEKDMQSWWEQQDFIVAQGNGIFTHRRIG